MINLEKQDGFTLLELLVTIAIIGILATMTVVKLTSGVDKARAAKIAQEIDGVQAALRIWMNEHDHWLTECEIQDLFDDPTNGVNALFCEGGQYPAGSGSCSLSRGCSNDAEPTVTWFMENTDFSRYIHNDFNLVYEYDNDGDEQAVDANGCVQSVAPYKSASLYIQGVEYLEIVDGLIDRGSGSLCGRFMWDSMPNRGIYKLGYTIYDF